MADYVTTAKFGEILIRTVRNSIILLHDYSLYFHASIKKIRLRLADYVTKAKFSEALSEQREFLKSDFVTTTHFLTHPL